MIDFDTIIDRKNTNSFKYDKYKDNVIPAWVADMDFLSPKCVIDALKSRVEHGVFGYTAPGDELEKSVVDFMARHHDFHINKNSIVWVSGVVASINIACSMLSKDESVITFSPIYPYFFNVPKSLGIEPICVPMREIENRWNVDFDEFESAIKPNTKMLLLCNPFNPGGTVFTKDELQKFADIAKKHNLIIVSDEIHADLVLSPDVKHIPIASLNDNSKNRTITLQAPSKTYNIAGLQSSYAIIENSELRKRFKKAMGHINGGVNLLAYTATKASLEGGDEWLGELKKYLRENLELVKEFVNKNPKLKMLSHDATYLAWIDTSALGENAHELFLNHGVGLSEGEGFGGEGFVRLNFGCPKSVLEEMLQRMQKAIGVI